LKIEILGEIESTFETALDNKSEDHLGTFGEIILGKKSYATVNLRKICIAKEMSEDIFEHNFRT
jgi:hypothetical protein